MRLSEFDSSDGKEMFSTKFDYNSLVVPQEWTPKNLLQFNSNLGKFIDELESYIDLYNDFVTAHGKKYRSTQPLNIKNRPTAAVEQVFSTMQKILRAIEEMDKIGKVKNEAGQGGTESGRKLIQKIKNDFHRVAQNMENVRRRLEQNPPDYSILVGKEHSEILGHFKKLNHSLLQGLGRLIQSMYSAIEQI